MGIIYNPYRCNPLNAQKINKMTGNGTQTPSEETQSPQPLLKKTAPIRQVLQAVSDKVPMVAVMTAFDEVGKLNFSTEIVFAFQQLGKNALLINAIDTHISTERIDQADMLIIDCPAGSNPITTDVADHANIVVVTLSASGALEACAELLASLHQNTHYHKPFEMVVSHAADPLKGEAVFDALEKAIAPFKIPINQLCLLCENSAISTLRETFHQVAEFIDHRLF